ncbi:MAG: alkaline phosphatase [Parcubacteria group bacterium RIFCSPLOWO2_01_FULL_40_65]|nr:MAG: alkaline phosphatase [Parcubacteria group bacterium RIFCSPHIGHO2_01_FULL_40_30]OHB19856.1 MAG: alkaline phosphatase [Parcubacteria group bacterium RIFCSPHIGHO2_02_FULL_40_12]OHB21567.1 MAG: alkaline phosphatase [Parcubacteria group bacterium RIFCSPLOWO2_01_FULL_40_65]OHB23507.1 MAG: alkaline phosphatase [Parcubacteria group bacterium RIFCSPLOWO2_02_FULL_40_12]OHB24018.1 MAG: alkaline phosphatase [Parcubacteria group bacterium RIFCSPLOWO2_12_FULL_40_10]
MFELVESVSRWALSIINQSGYFGIFILSALESAAIPIPSEVIIPFSGFLAEQGRFSFWLVVAVATIANTVGSIFLYLISLKGGRWILEKYGKYILISSHELDFADDIFSKYGSKIVFIGRILPIARTFISIPAGVTRMNFSKFVSYTVLGSLPWNFILALIGFKAGENWDILSPYFRKFDFVIIGGVAIGIIWYIYSHLKRRS